MKLKNKFAAFVLLSGLSSLACAQSIAYYPPERIDCRLDNVQKLSCNNFNRQILVEDAYTADLQQGKDEAFYFNTAVAFYAPQDDEATIFFTFRNAKSKAVKLRTSVTYLRPDLENGSWRKLNSEIYTCDAGYMSCGVVG